MKFNAFVVAAFAAVVAAQTDGLPTCATTCVGGFSSGASIGGCAQGDVKCVCSNQSFLGGIACCLAASCNASDQKAAIVYAANLCGGFGVQVPNEVTCATAPVSGSSVATSVSSSVSSSVASSVTATGTTSVSASASASASKNSTATSSASKTSSATASASPSSGAEAVVGSVGFAGVAGVLAVAAAML